MKEAIKYVLIYGSIFFILVEIFRLIQIKKEIIRMRNFQFFKLIDYLRKGQTKSAEFILDRYKPFWEYWVSFIPSRRGIILPRWKVLLNTSKQFNKYMKSLKRRGFIDSLYTIFTFCLFLSSAWYFGILILLVSLKSGFYIIKFNDQNKDNMSENGIIKFTKDSVILMKQNILVDCIVCILILGCVILKLIM